MALGTMFTMYVAFMVATPYVFLVLLRYAKKRKHMSAKTLPPGPPGLPIVGNLLELKESTSKGFEEYVRVCLQKYGPIITIWFGPSPLILIGDRHLAHDALIKKGAAFAERPVPGGFRKKFTCDGHNVNSARYGQLWRTFRANIAGPTGVLSHAGLAHFRDLRLSAVQSLIDQIACAAGGGVVVPREGIRNVVYRIATCLCFGKILRDKTLHRIQNAVWQMQGSGLLLDDSPISPFIPSKKKKAQAVRNMLCDVFIPLIKEAKEEIITIDNDGIGGGYLHHLLKLRIEESNRALTDDELVTLLAEFMTAGTDTTVTTLEWALARLVRHPDVQERLLEEISATTGGKRQTLTEEDVKEMKYLQAVIKETLRRHPPVHFVVTHAVHQDMEVGGYDIPAGSRVNFYVYGMSMDPDTWKCPEEFMPKRFLEERPDADVNGIKEIVMMPFGVGRRICPGINSAFIHMSLVLGRLVQCFKWDVVDGEKVDLAESQVLTTMMKHPLRSVVSKRSTSPLSTE